MASVQNDVLRVVAKMNDGADDVQNIYHLKITEGNPTSEGALATACAAFLDDAYSDFNAAVPDDITYTSVAVYNVTQDTPVGEVGWPSLIDGDKTTAKLPQQCSPLVLFTTAVLNSLGKKFLPTFTVTDCDTDGTLTSAAITALGNFAVTLLLGYDAGTWGLQPGNYRDATATFIPWVASQVRDFYATQRRRYAGSGS